VLEAARKKKYARPRKSCVRGKLKEEYGSLEGVHMK
jgi:hypothetical protein